MATTKPDKKAPKGKAAGAKETKASAPAKGAKKGAAAVAEVTIPQEKEPAAPAPERKRFEGMGKKLREQLYGAPCFLMLVAITVFGGWLRIHGLEDWLPAASDILRMNYAYSGTVWDVIRRVTSTSGDPALFYVLLHWLMEYHVQIKDLRWLGLVPGILLIPAFYVVGVVLARGRVAGLFMAFMAAINPILVIRSQLVSGDSLLLLFIICAWLTIRWYLDTLRYLALVFYALFAVAALWTDYIAIVPLVALSVLGTGVILARRTVAGVMTRARHHVPTLMWVGMNAALALFVGLQVSQVASHALSDGLEVLMPQSGASATWLQGLVQLASTMFLLKDSPLQGVMAVPLLFGCVMMMKKRLRFAFMSALLVVAVALTLSILRFYPMGANRDSIVLIPFVMLPIAYAVQYICQYQRRFALPLLLPCFVLPYCVAMFDGFKPEDQRFKHAVAESHPELTMRVSDLDKAVEALDDKISRKDVMLVTRSMGFRFRYFVRYLEETPPLKSEIFSCTHENFRSFDDVENCYRREYLPTRGKLPGGRVWVMESALVQGQAPMQSWFYEAEARDDFASRTAQLFYSDTIIAFELLR